MSSISKSGSRSNIKVIFPDTSNNSCAAFGQPRKIYFSSVSYDLTVSRGKLEQARHSFYFLYLVRFCTTGLHPASGTFHPYPAAALHNSVNQSYMLHLFWQIFQSLPPSSCNLLMFSLPLLSSIPRSRSMGTPLQYRQIHRKTLFLTDSFFLFL